MAIREPKLHSLKADKTFGNLKRGQEFKAYILRSYVEGEKTERIEMAELTFSDGLKVAAPYAFFSFVEPSEE